MGLSCGSVVKILPSSAEGQGSVLVREPRSHMPCDQKNPNIKLKQYCNKLNKDFKKGPHQKKKKKEEEDEAKSLWGERHREDG